MLALVKGSTVFINYIGELFHYKPSLLSDMDRSCCVGLFVNPPGTLYKPARAQEVAFAHGRKTIMSSDVLQALELTEFGDMVPSLNKELEGMLVESWWYVLDLFIFQSTVLV